jgi:hypothetical protein
MLPLPELAAAPAGAAPAWRVMVASGRTRPVARWFHHWTDGKGRRWLSFGRIGGDYLLSFARHGCFRVSPGHRTITCEGGRAVPAETRRHLLLNQVLPLVLGTERLVLHASAVVMPGGAIAFAGAGGAGKSTLSTALAGRGHMLLSDDIVALDKKGPAWLAEAGPSSVRLWTDSLAALLGRSVSSRRAAHYTRKRLVDAAGVLPMATSAAPLAAVCLLHSGAERQRVVSIERVRPRDALVLLLPFAFQLDVADPASLRLSMDRLAALVADVPVFTLHYPRLFRALPEVLDRLGALALHEAMAQA